MYKIDELLVATKYKFAFLEDIQDETKNIKVLRTDLELFSKRINDIGFGLDIGKETEDSNSQIYISILKVLIFLEFYLKVTNI
jgi:hypothetical protein